ncbi:MAG: isoprenylcysteine carboxylmethyltransferase family protein [Rhizobiaceae bacterium]|nr:isoprenylcysteine carboxylmethyltransferase family protein [Rhizobiaceae bacterium]
MNAYRVKPMKFPWTPVVYLAAVAIALLLNRLDPLGTPPQWHLTLQALGTVAGVAGLWLVLWGYGKLLRHRTALLSSSATTHLVTSGPYRFSRNPVYLGYTLIMLGAGLLTGNLWMALAAAFTPIVTHAWIVRNEEKHLLARFGFEFECYCRRTRAWI